MALQSGATASADHAQRASLSSNRHSRRMPIPRGSALGNDVALTTRPLGASLTRPAFSLRYSFRRREHAQCRRIAGVGVFPHADAAEVGVVVPAAPALFGEFFQSFGIA